jgi:hypothetical protein
MAEKKTRADLEILFSSGKIPTQSNFADLIASGISQKDDGLQKANDTPLKIQAPVTVETDAKTPKDLILFYGKLEDDAAKWRIGTRSDSLEINRVGQSDFLIDANGNVGIGTGADKPGAKLHVVGNGLFASSGGPEFGAVNLGDANHGIKSTRGDGVTIFSFQVPIGIHLKQTTGNVGIGTTTPGFPLTFVNTFGDKISLWGQSGNSYGFGIQSALLQIHTDSDAADIAFGFGSSAAFRETMRIKGNGNVGIGTTPEARLHISESAGTVAAPSQGSIVIDHESNGGASSIVFRSKINRGSDYGYIQYQDAATGGTGGESSRLIIGIENDADDHLILKPSGFVGIGTTTPVNKLHVVAPGGFGAEDADGICQAGNVAIVAQSNGTAFGILNGNNRQAFALNIDNNAGTKISRGAPTFYDKFDGSWHQCFSLKNGCVGIGTYDPRVPLEVRGVRGFPLTDSPDGFSNNGGFNVGFGLGGGGGNFNLSILAEGWVGGAGIVANSDRRIKEIVGLSDTAQDLEIIQKMRVTDYRPLDKMTEGSSLRRGFIAQEVIQVFPQAVGKRTNVIPDIYSDAVSFAFDEERKTLSITLLRAHELAKGQVVKILTEDASKTATVIAVPTSDSFVVDNFEKEPRRVFVYGRQVDDFLSVHYDQIFSTGIGAIQELNKIVASKNARITSLEIELSALKQCAATKEDATELEEQVKVLRRQLFAQDKRLSELETKEKTHNGSRAVVVGER